MRFVAMKYLNKQVNYKESGIMNLYEVFKQS